jgi:hypothetical protein
MSEKSLYFLSKLNIIPLKVEYQQDTHFRKQYGCINFSCVFG